MSLQLSMHSLGPMSQGGIERVRGAAAATEVGRSLPVTVQGSAAGSRRHHATALQVKICLRHLAVRYALMIILSPGRIFKHCVIIDGQCNGMPYGIYASSQGSDKSALTQWALKDDISCDYFADAVSV